MADCRAPLQEALGLPVIELGGYEADDLIATYAGEARSAQLVSSVVVSCCLSLVLSSSILR